MRFGVSLTGTVIIFLINTNVLSYSSVAATVLKQLKAHNDTA